MKKLCLSFLVLFLILSLSACGGNEATTNNLTEEQIRKIVQEEMAKVEMPDVDVSEITKNVLSALKKENEFVAGKELICPLGKNFEMNIIGGSSVEIKDFKVTQYKKADYNNKEDYFGSGSFYPYIYEVTYNGKTSEKYAGYELSIEFGFPSGATAFKNAHNNVINKDGSFEIKHYLYSYSLETEILPSWVSAFPKMD